MSEKDDGGPAFPHLKPMFRYSPDGDVLERISGEIDGMSLRDYFAAKAIAALVIAGSQRAWPDDAAEAYRAADAMLKARQAGGA